MRFATRNEIEYLGSVDGHVTESVELVDEMCQRLDACGATTKTSATATGVRTPSRWDWQPDRL